MAVYPHTLNLYQKPALGNAFIRRSPVYNYRHTIAAIGGFDTASFDIAVRSRDEGQQFLDQYIGNRVAIYVDNPVEPIWEGFINRMTFSAGGVEYSIGLDEMANRVTTIYTTVDGNSATTQSVAVNSTDSQDIYGIKQAQVDIGFMQGGTGATILRDTVLAQRAWPKTSILPSGGGGGLLHIECLGFYHTLMWEALRITTSASVQLGVQIDNLLALVTNGTTFFDNADTTETDANTNTINQQMLKGETLWDGFKKVQETGDTTNYFVLGITPTLFSTGTRRMYYRAANADIEYTARQSDGLRIRNLYGQLVPPWTVRPDRGVRVSDMLVGWNGVGDNPTETYIMKVDYDANRQRVIYSGDDNLSAEGVFNLRRFNQQRGRPFGAPRRLA